MLLAEFEVKDTAAMLRWIGVAEGDVADELEGLLNDAVAELLCLEPKIPPRTAARMSINPIAPHNIIRFLVKNLRAGMRRTSI